MLNYSYSFHKNLWKISSKQFQRFSKCFRSDLSHSAYAGDTIYALSSGTLTKSGVAVVRLSGPNSLYTFHQLQKPEKRTQTLTPRLASLKSLYCPFSNEMIDKALVLWFPAPKSFTGEDVIELHVHGSRAVISSLFQTFEKIGDASTSGIIRPAEPGEFTRRAFENGKMDLTEVEGLSDLLEAETSSQRKQALRQMEGHIRIVYERWREELIKCLAHTEAVIDFGDDDREGDINEGAMLPLKPVVRRIMKELSGYLEDGRKGEIIREGIQIALVGQPNAGKSSLLNSLARRPAAIVSPIAGTTRDVVEVRMDIGGVACIFRDTAGIRISSNDLIELEGIKRAREAFEQAQLKLFVVDVSSPESLQDSANLYHDLISNDISNVITIFNKIDLLDEKQLPLIEEKWKALISTHKFQTNTHFFRASCTKGKGIDLLESGIGSILQSLLRLQEGSEQAEGVIITRERHRFHLKKCAEHLGRFLDESLSMDLAAEEIRLGMMELGKITGRVDVEELLDIIFRDFCIGK